MSKIEVNAIEPQCGTTLTIGASDTNIAGIGTVNWDTTAKTAGFTAVSGRGYFVNTTSGAITATLPAGSAGAIVAFADYANTFDTNNLTIAPNGTDKIGGTNGNAKVSTEGASTTFVYVDSTQGWKQVNDATLNTIGESFIVATGGCVSCCGDYKIHTFTGPGTFTVCSVGNNPANNAVDYLIVAGGGGGGNGEGGGGGAGGYRESSGTASGCYTVSPLGACVSALPVSAQAYPITVGGGGTTSGGTGNPSIFSTITSAGGGGGGVYSGSGTPGPGGSGGSGGGAGGENPSTGPTGTGGAGNTPPVSPPQGNPGGDGGPYSSPFTFGGGGGAGAAGGNGTPSAAGSGGNGLANSITGTSVTRAGGGGGGRHSSTPSELGGPGGTGGGGTGNGVAQPGGGSAGTDNTGGGGGGAGGQIGAYFGTSFQGGSGIVIIRYKYQ